MCLFGGALADRLPKKYLIITCLAVTAVISLAIAVALSTGYLSSTNHASWWVLIFTSVIQGGLTGIMEPARISIISEIVGEKQVMNAISLTMMGQNISRLIGPAVAGFLVDKFQFSAVYYLNTGIYVIAVIFAIFLPRTGKQVTRSTNTLQDVVAGLRYARRETGLLLVVLFGFTIVIFGMPYVQLTPVFTESILKVGASGLGILTSVSGIGALVGSFILASLPNRKRGIMLVMSGVIMGIAVIVFAWSKSWPLSLAIVPFAQLGPTIHQTMVATLIQSYADPSYRGRMQSLATMSVPLSSLGTFFASVLADSPIGIEWAVGGMAILLTIVSFGFLAFARPLTKLE
jgi:MFS family permease